MPSGKWYKGVHKPIITKKLFDDAQAAIQQLRRVTERKTVPDTFAFTRLMRCGTCGSGITAMDKHKIKKNGETVLYRYYACSNGRDRWCRERFINEIDLIQELMKLFDKLNIDLIGTREQLEAQIERGYRIDAFLTGQPAPERSLEQKEVDLRKWAKIVFEDGAIEERRAMLGNIKSRIILKNKHVYLDTVPPEENTPRRRVIDEYKIAIRQKARAYHRRYGPHRPSDGDKPPIETG